MSLICDETQRDIPFDKPLYCGTRSDMDTYSALSPEVIDQIPNALRRDTPRCPTIEGGVDIHECSGNLNPMTGSYSFLSGFTLGGFLFSIDETVAKQLMPRHYKRYETKDKERTV